MGALREKERENVLMEEISKLRKILKELEDENLKLSELFEKLKKENKQLGLEIDRLEEEIVRLTENREPVEPPF